MNSLHESIARRRAALRGNEANAATMPDTSACMVLGSRPNLVLARWQAETWIFPWSHLQWARFSTTEAADELVLAFPHHEVVVTGEDLHALVEPVAEYRLAALRNLPASYHAQLTDGSPVVAGIDVREMDQS